MCSHSHDTQLPHNTYNVKLMEPYLEYVCKPLFNFFVQKSNTLHIELSSVAHPHWPVLSIWKLNAKLCLLNDHELIPRSVSETYLEHTKFSNESLLWVMLFMKRMFLICYFWPKMSLHWFFVLFLSFHICFIFCFFFCVCVCGCVAGWVCGCLF